LVGYPLEAAYNQGVFKEELMVLVHLGAGAPARATELLSIRHINGVEARNQRGVFIDNGTVSFVTVYYKGFSASLKAKVIHRYVPREVGELVVQFLWLVQPFIKQLQAAVTEEPGVRGIGQSDGIQGWIWEPHLEEDWGIDEDEEAAELGGEADGKDEADDKAVDKEDNKADDEETDSEGEEGSTMQEKQQEAENIDGFWDTNRVRRVIGRKTERRIGMKIGVVLWS
jgi:superfamily II DNA or RNA helicase